MKYQKKPPLVLPVRINNWKHAEINAAEADGLSDNILNDTVVVPKAAASAL